MIYVSLQDLHLVQSMDWISELSRRYHSVRMHILTPYGEVFPTRPVGNESTYWRKGHVYIVISLCSCNTSKHYY